MFRDRTNSPRLVIGVLTPMTGGFYYGNVINGILRTARKNDVVAIAFETFKLNLFNGNTVLSSSCVDGWLAVNEFSDSSLLAELRAQGAPIVHLHSKPDFAGGTAVLPDNKGGACAVTEHLIEHGHRHIVFAGNTWHVDVAERLLGYRRAMEAAGLAVTDDMVIETPHHKHEDGRTVALELMRRRAGGAAKGLGASALVAATDRLALGAMGAFAAGGVHVPDDIAIVGFDDSDAAQFAEPPLTTVKQSFSEAAECAVGELLALIRRERLPEPLLRVPTSAVIRRSCGCSLSHSIPPSPPEGGNHRVEILTGELLRFASRNRMSRITLSEWPGAEKIAKAIDSSINGNALPESVRGEWWAGLMACASDAESTVRAMELLESTLKGWSATGDEQRQVGGVLRDLRVALIQQWQRTERVRVEHYEDVTEAAYRLTSSLSQSGMNPSSNLGWIRWSQAQHACCALWTTESTTPQIDGDSSELQPPNDRGSASLVITGEYTLAEGAFTSALEPSSISPAQFPPITMLETAHKEGSILSVASVPRGRGGEYGLLAVVAPLPFEHLEYVGTPGDWGVQLGTALDRAQAERELRASAEQDSLTGLSNRATLLKHIEALRQSDGAPAFSLLFIDLDDFKKINDSLGHEAGDQLLVQIANRISGTIASFSTKGPSDQNLLARVGGDEFVAVLVGMESEADAIAFVEQVQTSLREPYELLGRTVFVSASIGINFGQGTAAGSQELLRGADTAMYRAKMRGHAHHEFFHHGMHARALEKLDLDEQLRLAMERHELELWYQPIINLVSGTDVGAEALIRWRSPEQGLIPPARFLPIAEEVGLSIPLSEWTLRRACGEAVRFQAANSSALYVNVNFPAEHIKHPGFVDFVEQALHESGLDPRVLGVEIVESTLLDEPAKCIQALSQLRELGVRIAIDDFGTGYSNLSYLRDFPLSTLKIDRSFVQNVPTNRADNGIARAIIAMGQELGLTIVAEGIETLEQYHFLKQAGCDFGQGYLMSKPLEISAYIARLSALGSDSAPTPIHSPPRNTPHSGARELRRVRNEPMPPETVILAAAPDSTR